jgi:octaprenyl-diphosphate synthase
MNVDEEAASSGSLPSEFAKYRTIIDNAILAELGRRRDSAYFEPLRQAVKRGKRIRPTLLVLSFESVNRGGSDPYPAAVAVELAHLESLIHDDIIDRDFQRRGTPVFHAVYGHEMALLSADFILSMILDMATRYEDPRVGRTLAWATSSMCEGELEELRAYKNKKTVSVQEYNSIVLKKTASLFEASAAIGAVVGGAQEDEVRALSNYARLLGIAYQVQDDIADLGKGGVVENLSIPYARLSRVGFLREMSVSNIHEAKESLRELRPSGAKNLLIKLADLIISPRVDSSQP